MLDDLKMIHERDPQDTLGIAQRQWQQLSYEFETSQSPVNVDNIIYAGMGGSSLAAVVSTSWPGYNIPFQVVRDYDIPDYVSERTYFIAASYSGNTEETLSALEQAEARGAQIAVIAGGGKLVEIAEAKGYPLAILPKAEQPRYAVFYNLRALLALLNQAGLTDKAQLAELEKADDFVRSIVEPWIATVPTNKNQAKQIALECIGKSAVVYAGPKLAPAAYKWKISFNENAKQIAWWNSYPEFNHNEFMGWTKQPTQKPYAVIDLRSSLEHPRIQKRFEVSERLLSGLRPAPIVVEAEGKTLLEHLLWTIALGDFVTIYTALLNGVNPAPVDLIEKFKKALDE
ncbi:MAG TPA: bifunctional phosphoglucose/phosphomannose isomerase [Candidatus Saccharimonadales bacterium]|jgi:glucose/mannose-6-phosphate isomerase|nr:bifunctional phosphoglucose/phosphomannose isomerase [Candidatus Saccharimonadales bacterium]